MARIYLIRHGKAAASFTSDMDPGLDDKGREQAITSCEALKPHLPLLLRSSPLKRAYETAQPLSEATGQPITLEPRVAEIPSPGLSLEERGPWLQQVMSGHWLEQSDDLIQWRAELRACLLSLDEDTAIFSHFVAINAAVGLANGDDTVLIFRPDNGSITVFDNDAGTLTLIERGAEAVTRVN